MKTKSFPSWEEFSQEHQMFSSGDHVICATSGGMDSMALLHMLCQAREGFPLSVTAVHFNHHLRGEESFRDENFVREACRALDVPLIIGGAEVGDIARETGKGIEETARILRYAFLEETAKTLGASAIATAHHREDSGETILFHLIRGAGLRGLSGIPPKRGKIVRPLLNWSKAEIQEYVRFHEISFVEDSSNKDVTFTRNRIRHDVMPVLEELQPNLSKILGETGVQLGKIQAFLEKEGAKLLSHGSWEGENFSIAIHYLREADEVISATAMKLLLERMGLFQSEKRHIDLILGLLESQNPSVKLSLPKGILCQRSYETLRFFRGEEKKSVLLPQVLKLGNSYVWGEYLVSLEEGIFPVSQDVYSINKDALVGELRLRTRQTGDDIALSGGKRKSLKKLLIEKKIPRDTRDSLPILADETGLVAVLGLGVDKQYQGKEGEKTLTLRFQQQGEKEG